MKNLLALLFFCPILIWSQADFKKAEDLFEAGKYEQATPIFENFLKENPNHLKTIEYLGDIAGKSKSWDKAIFCYKKLKQLKPSEANYFYKYGGALGMKAKDANKIKALGMIGEIKQSFEKSIELNPKHIEARWALLTIYIQLPGFVGGSETKAIQYSNELLKLSPVDGYLSRGQIEEYFKRYSSAENYYKKAFQIGNSKTGFQFLYNLYLNKIKDPQKAQELKKQFEK